VANISGWQFVERAKGYLNELRQQKNALQTRRREHDSQIAEVNQEKKKALLELAEYSLPKLEPEFFQSVKMTLGFGQFVTQDPIVKMESERARVQTRVQELQQNAKVVNSENYLHPTTGTFSTKLQEANEQLKIISQVLSQYDAEPKLIDLFSRKYKTPEYQNRWWHATYYSDWKWGDILEEKFGKEIPAMSAEYTSYSRDKATLEEEVRDLTREREQLTKLSEEYKQLTAALSDFTGYTLKQCQQKLADHLEHSDKEHLFNIAKGDPARESLVKKIHGIEKKQEYLRELGKKHFQEQEDYLNALIGRVSEKSSKYGRSAKKMNASIPQHEVDKMLPDFRGKLGDRDRRFHKHSNTIVVFDRYDYFDYQRDMLWWDVMTDGRLDGNFIPEVNEFHHHHPGYVYESHHHHHHDHHDSFMDAGTSISNDSASSSSFGDPS
jgi:hypothetical protein